MSTFNTETNEWDSFRLEGFETIANIRVNSREEFEEMIRNSRTGYLVEDNFVMSEFYAKAFELRGGVPDIEYRVFQMVKNNRMVEFLEYLIWSEWLITINASLQISVDIFTVHM